MRTVIDKKDVLSNLPSGGVRLEIGCGESKKDNEAIGIDRIDYDCVDIVGDALEVLKRFPDGSVAHIYTSHFLEHVGNIDELISEFGRVLVAGGECEIRVPHFSNPFFYSDSTHKTFFGLYTMSAFAEDRLHSRRVPTYSNDVFFVLESVDLVFKSPPPFYFRYLIKRLVGSIFNSCAYMRELYEENFCYVFPCYELIYVLVRK